VIPKGFGVRLRRFAIVLRFEKFNAVFRATVVLIEGEIGGRGRRSDRSKDVEGVAELIAVEGRFDSRFEIATGVLGELIEVDDRHGPVASFLDLVRSLVFPSWYPTVYLIRPCPQLFAFRFFVHCF
jgi:hypothetical protein